MKRTDFYWILPTALALAAALTWIGPGAFFPGWLAFSALALISLVLLKATHHLTGNAKTLAWILTFAFALRLGLGVGAYILEPIIGYDNEVNKAGYLFTDAYTRDGEAWQLASSPNSLMTAFDEKLVSDQYGGLLGMSALIYRYLSPDAHRPLLVTLLAALFGALGAAFVWGAGQRLRDASFAKTAALVFAFFPEAILLGASQMREPFLMTFIALAFYGLIEWQATHKRLSWLWIGLALAGMLIVSPGFILITLIAAAGWLYFGQGERRIPWQAVIVALAVFVLAFVVLSVSWSSLVAVKTGGPLGIAADWARETVKWNKDVLQKSSGIVQLVLQNWPSSLHLPFIAIYGLLQPVLPAVIFEGSTPFWQILGIIRSLGWYLMLPMLAYAPFATAGMDKDQKKRWLWLALLMWAWALIAALRGGADQWDNPRYRVIVIALQALVITQTLFSIKQTRGRWLLRILTVEAVMLVVFTHWYAYRYLSIGFNLGIRNTIVLALGLSILFVLGDWLIEKWRLKQKPKV